MNIRDLLEERASLSADKVYLYFKNEKYTYHQFDRRVNQAANVFIELGIGKGDCVGLMIPNSPEFLFAWFGLNKIGAIMVPINTGFKINETLYIIDHCEAKGIIASEKTLDVAASVFKESSTLKWIATVGCFTHETVLNLIQLWDQASTSLSDIQLEEDDTASIIYTSGTTGPPKGVMHSHKSYVLCGEGMIVRADLTSKDRMMIILPLFHANAQFYSVMGSLVAEASIILIPRFSASQFWEQAKHYKATQFNFIGAIGRILATRPEEEFHKDHCFRVANGGLIPKDVYQALRKKFEISHVIDGYGLTECPCVCQNPINATIKIGSMGLAARHPDPSIEFSKMKIVDEEDREVSRGKTGELVLQSPLLMKGYLKEKQQTQHAMRGGWFHTGDYCFQDEDGYFFFVDRKKDIIRRKGENISSVEIEGVINSNPKVIESAVIAIPSNLSEDEVKAFIVCKDGKYVSPYEIIDWCMERLADFKVPRYIEYLEHLPKTPSERIAKYILKEKKTLDKGVDMETYIKNKTR